MKVIVGAIALVRLAAAAVAAATAEAAAAVMDHLKVDSSLLAEPEASHV